MSHHRLSLAAGLVAACVVVLVAGCGTPSQRVNATKAPEPTIQVVMTVTTAEPAAQPADESQPTPNETPALDEFDVIQMQAPDLCNPENPQYTNLSEIWDEKIVPYGDRAYAKVIYQNEKKQKFNIFVDGANDDEGKADISTYIENAQVCLETMVNDSPETFTPDPIDTAQTITDPEELAILETIEEIAVDVQNNEPSPLVLSISVGVATPDNWYQDYDRLRVELEAGALSESNFAMIEEYASNFGQTEPVFSQLEGLKRDEDEMKRQDFANWFIHDFLKSYQTALHFSVDPDIAPGKSHNYKAFCNEVSARVKMDVSMNVVNLFFWQDSPYREQGPTGIPQGSSSGWWSWESSTPTTFHSIVTGGAKPGFYVLNKSWIKGAGCR